MGKKRKNNYARKDKVFLRLLVIFTFLSVVLGLFIWFKSPSTKSQKVSSENSLQLDVYYPGQKPPAENPPQQTSPPNPNVACSHDTGQPIINTGKPVDPSTCYCSAFLIDCKNRKCVKLISYAGQEKPEGCGFAVGLSDLYCSDPVLAPTDGVFCIGKPVIYLYPEEPTAVNVGIQTSGEVFVSDPQIEKGNKWTNVFAEPSGKLTYEGKIYRELFYESNVVDVKKPEKGLTLNSGNLNNELDAVISRLGLVDGEKTEFLDFWIPRLNNLNSKYIFFGIIEPEEKNKVDKVLIEPKPDTMIEFIAYFAPLDKPFEGKKLDLPSTPPERIGFTAVEWGGTVGR